MNEHDPLCQASINDDTYFCVCEFIVQVRADEREKVNESWQVDFDKEMTDLRAKVAALWVHSPYYSPDNSYSDAIDDVLDLIDGG